MARIQESVLPDRPSRPRWVYAIGLVAVLMLLAAIFFALAYCSENYVDPEKAEPPIITVPSAPRDGESDQSGR